MRADTISLKEDRKFLALKGWLSPGGALFPFFHDQGHFRRVFKEIYPLRRRPTLFESALVVALGQSHDSRYM